MSRVIVEIRDRATGRVRHREEGKNLVVRTGWNMLACAMASPASGSYAFRINKVRCGSGTTPANVEDTDLETPWGAMALKTADSNTQGSYNVTSVYTIAAGTYTGQVLAEIGYFYDEYSGTVPIDHPGLYARYVLASPHTVLAGDDITITHVRTFAGVP